MLKTRLINHVAQMAPHQRERTGGKLIVDSLAHITQLENEMRYLIAVIDANMECGSDPRVKYAKTLVSPNAPADLPRTGDAEQPKALPIKAQCE